MGHVFRSILAAQILILPALAWAEDGEVIQEADREVVRSRTRMDFNDAQIDGDLVGPEGSYVPGSGRVRFKSLIELREDFHEELRTSADSDL